MGSSSIDELLEQVGNWSIRNSRHLSETAKQAFVSVPFMMQEIEANKDYKALMDLSFLQYGKFNAYIDQLSQGNIEPIAQFRVGTPNEAKIALIRKLREEFMQISGLFYDLFGSAAQKLIESQLENSVTRVSSHAQIEDDGVYLVVVRREGRIKLVEGTYRSTALKDSVGNGDGAKLSIPAIMEKGAYNAGLHAGSVITREEPLTPGILQVATIREGLVYRIRNQRAA